MMIRRFLPSLILFLAGCAGANQDGRAYPSLARRPIESTSGFAPSPPAAPAPLALAPAPVDTSDLKAITAKVSGYSGQVESGKKSFDAAYPRVASTVRSASGSAVLSEGWVTANMGISTLESARNETVSGLAGLDRLYIDRMDAIAQGVVTGGTDEINAVRIPALQTVDSQNDRLDELKGALAKP
jgi:hypothetical protein